MPVTGLGSGTSRLSLTYGGISRNVGGVNAFENILRLAADINGVSVYGTFNNFSDHNASRISCP